MDQLWGFPGGSDGKDPACIAGNPGSIPGSGRHPGEGNGYSALLPGQFRGQRSMVDYSPWGHKESDITEQLTRSHQPTVAQSILPFHLNFVVCSSH